MSMLTYESYNYTNQMNFNLYYYYVFENNTLYT